METLFDALLFRDDLSSEERSQIEEALDDDPSLATAWARWCEVRRHLRDRLESTVSDRRLLVLYVLEQEGDDEGLTPRDRELLSEARPEIEAAVESSPALEHVVERIRDERVEFEETWEAHMDDSERSVEDTGATASSVRSGRPDRTDRAPRSGDRAREKRWMGRLVTAGLIVLVGVLTVLYWPEGETGTTITVADGETKVTELVDGSTVRLVGPAALSHRMNTEEVTSRRVELKRGQAFFDVQRRADASFVVRTPSAEATVLGTQFGVSTRADTTEVVLASGSVRVTAVGQEEPTGVVLEPGQRSWVARGTTPAPPTPVDVTAELEWTGLFVFRSMPLSTIAERLRERYDVTITVSDPLADATVTGTFEREQPVDEVLDALAATLGARVERPEKAQYRIVPEA